MSLKSNIEEFKSGFVSQVPEQIRDLMDKAQQDIEDSGIAERALKAGSDAVDFELPNTKGELVSSKALRRKGPIVVSFYRGGWCPYCSLELRALQGVNAEILSLGAQLIAISPQLPDKSLSTEEKNELEFEVLSDARCEVADQYGLTFSLDENLRPVYEHFNPGGELDLVMVMEWFNRVVVSYLATPSPFYQSDSELLMLFRAMLLPAFRSPSRS